MLRIGTDSSGSLGVAVQFLYQGRTLWELPLGMQGPWNISLTNTKKN
jgi:hypothetical protein